MQCSDEKCKEDKEKELKRLGACINKKVDKRFLWTSIGVLLTLIVTITLYAMDSNKKSTDERKDNTAAIGKVEVRLDSIQREISAINKQQKEMIDDVKAQQKEMINEIKTQQKEMMTEQINQKVILFRILENIKKKDEKMGVSP